MSNNPHQDSELYRVIIETRKLFHTLAEASTELNKESGITASMRAVMETLFTNHTMTVPDIARHKNVTRQHIQQIINELLVRELVHALENPAHKRSPLIRLSQNGTEQFKSILHREKQLLASLAKQFDEQELQDAANILESIRSVFDSSA